MGILTIYIIYYTIMVDIPQISHHTIIIINHIFTVILLYHIIISNFQYYYINHDLSCKYMILSHLVNITILLNYGPWDYHGT